MNVVSDRASMVVVDDAVLRLYAEAGASGEAYLDHDEDEGILRLLPPGVRSAANLPAQIHFGDANSGDEGLHIFALPAADGGFTVATISRDANGTSSTVPNILVSANAVFSTTRGIYETEVLRHKRVAVVGLGSGGGLIALELAKTGVSGFVLIDHDRLEPKNIARHVCGISDLGRFKTRAMRDMILDRNPLANVVLSETECTLENRTDVERLIAGCDIILCCTDNRESRLLINAISLALGISMAAPSAARTADRSSVSRRAGPSAISASSICFRLSRPTARSRPRNRRLRSRTAIASCRSSRDSHPTSRRSRCFASSSPFSSCCAAPRRRWQPCTKT